MAKSILSALNDAIPQLPIHFLNYGIEVIHTPSDSDEERVVHTNDRESRRESNTEIADQVRATLLKKGFDPEEIELLVFCGCGARR